MSGIFSAIGSGNLMDEFALIIRKNPEDLRQILSGI
jgi:F0F1-type ATP synthase membrane subunit c/vacuolar-type H+-ATPase subunit K